MEEITTIRISKKTKKELDGFGNKNDSYEDVILKLMKGGITKNEKIQS